MKTLDSIRAVTFDVGGTLIEPWPSVGHVYAEVAARLGYGSFPASDLNGRFLQAWQSKVGFDYSQAAWCGLVECTFSDLVPAARLPILFEALYDRFREATAWRIYEDVHPTLAALRAQGHKLGIISNWDERLRPLLHQLRLAEWFDVIIVSQEAGAIKPDPALFGLAAAQLGLSASAILHVGDSQREDYQGAREAGFTGLWLARDKEAQSGRIGSLSEILW